ncbi:MAG: Sec-independent protein translocase protein TatB [Pseudomonadota bacterium]
MPDIGGLEFLVIAVVALIILGPKDLTKMFRQLGQYTGRVRGMAREFSRAMNDAADEAGVNELSRDLRSISNPKRMGMDAVNKAFEGVDPTKYPEGSETRKLAETRAAEGKARAEEYKRIREEKLRQAESGPVEAATDAETGAKASEP